MTDKNISSNLLFTDQSIIKVLTELIFFI